MANIGDTYHKSLGITVDNILPSHVTENNKQFVKFIRAYYDVLEYPDMVNNVLHAMGDLHALDFSDDNEYTESFFNLFMQEYAPSFPEHLQLRKDLFFALTKKFFLAKGSVDSIKSFFRIVYDSDVDVFFPPRRLISYEFRNKSVIRTLVSYAYEGEYGNLVSKFERLSGKFISGNRGAAAKVQSIEWKDLSSTGLKNLMVTLRLSNTSGVFTMGEQISFSFSQYENLLFYVSGILTEPVIENPGLGYKPGDLVFVSDGTELIQAKVKIESVGSRGEIRKIFIIDPGLGYSGSPVAVIKSVSGKGASVKFKGGSYTTFIKDHEDKLRFFESDTSFVGDDNIKTDYVYDPDHTEDYVEYDYFENKSGTKNFLDYLPSKIYTNDPKTKGKLYFEIHIKHEHGLINDMDFVVAVVNSRHDTQRELGSDENSWAYNISRKKLLHAGEQIDCPTDYHPYLPDSRIIVGVDFIEKNIYMGIHHFGWMNFYDPSKMTPAFKNINIADGLRIAVSGRFTPYTKIRLCTHRDTFDNDMFLATRYFGVDRTIGAGTFIPDPTEENFTKVTPWDDSGAVFFSSSNDETDETGVLYRYKIKTSIPSIEWRRIYKSCVHPVGLQYTVEMVNNSMLTDSKNLGVKAFVHYNIKSMSFPVYDIYQRGVLALGDTFDSLNSLGRGTTVHDQITRTYDQDTIVNVTVPVDIKIKSLREIPPD